MALVTEDGTGLATAESLCSVADADTRMTGQGNTDWGDLTTTEKEQALRRATQFMEQAYRVRWKGMRKSITQALSWPRSWVTVEGYPVSASIVPADIANACADLAFKAAHGDLNADLSPPVIREKVGPIETEYAAHGSERMRYPSIDMALAPYLTGGGANVSLVRT